MIIGPGNRGAQSGTRLVGDRDLDLVAEDIPFSGQDFGDPAAVAVFDPAAPLSARILDRFGPADVSIRRPRRPTGWGQHEPVGLGVVEDHLGEGEQIRGPPTSMPASGLSSALPESWLMLSENQPRTRPIAR